MNPANDMDVLKAKSILLVDDDQQLRAALKKMLEKFGLHVHAAEDGSIAVQILMSEHVDLVLSDIQMPNLNGVELTQYVKQNHSIPVILMTAFSNLLESKEAAELGADAFFPKPFDINELRRTMQNLLKAEAAAAAPAASEEQTFYSLPVEEFTSGRNIPYPIYLRIFEKKFIRIAHQGEDLDLHRVLHYKSKGVRALYLTSQDFRAYVGFNLNLTEAAQKVQGIDRSTKLKLMKHTGEVLMEQIRQEGLDPDSYEITSTFVKNTVDLLCEDHSVIQLLDRIHNQADHLYAHSVGVSTFGVMIARQLGWTLPTNLFKIGMAGMLHDIGEKEIDPDLLNKPRTQWGPSDVKTYEQHSHRGFENVRTLPTIPEDVLQVIKDHHENCMSTGFPLKLKRSAIHPLAKLIAVADEFCKRIMRSPSQPGMEADAAIREMLQFSVDLLDGQFFRALMSLYKYDPPESFKKRMGYSSG